ncbi:MAG: MG2 domain-containing protein [Gemmataceae bacterium]
MQAHNRLRKLGLLQFGLIGVIVLAVLGYALLGPRSLEVQGAELIPAGAAVFQTKDQFLVTVSLANPSGQPVRGLLQVQLLGPNGAVLSRSAQNVSQTDKAAGYRFELPAPNVPTDQLKLRFQFGEQEETVPVSDVLLAKAHETSLTTSQEFYAGSLAAVRCSVHGVKSYTATVPLAGAEVAITLKAPDGTVYPLHEGKTGTDGQANAEIRLPRVPPGAYTMEVATKSTLGEEKLAREVRVKAEPKIMLVTDKPLYQPGQVMHIRALTLQPFDLTPVAGGELTIEVEDGKGNKVFKRTKATSEYGIAAVDFQLADEVNMGDYQVRAILGAQQAQKTVIVKKYVLPKFKVDAKADKQYYLPKETIKVELQADYFFGKPVAGGKIEVTASTFDVQFKEFQKWDGKTDANGHAQFDMTLPDYFVGQPLSKGDAIVKLDVKLTDTADHSETITRTYPVSNQAIRVSLIPEGGRLLPNVENRVFVAAVYPDGSPVVCDVQLWQGQQAKDKPLATLQTNAAGLAEFRLTPKAEQFRLGEWEQRNIEMLGGQTINVGGQKKLLDMVARAQDTQGNQAQTVGSLNADPFGDNVLLRTNKAICQSGDSLQLDVLTSTGMPTVYLDVVRGGQTMLTRWFDVQDGQATYKLDLPPDLFGTLEIHAYQMLNSGVIIRDSRVVYVQPSQDLNIEVKPDQDVYGPGQTGTIRFQVTDAAGKPTPAALGIIIVDEAVYALQEMQPGLEKVYFTLQEELLKPQVQVEYESREDIGVLVREPVLTADKRQIAEVLLTAVKPKPPARWQVTPAFDRKQKIEGLVQVVGSAVYHYAMSNQPFMEYDTDTKQWRFRPNLLKEMAAKGYVNANAILDPLTGKSFQLEDMARLEPNFTVERLAQAVTWQRMHQLYWPMSRYGNDNRALFLENDVWKLSEDLPTQVGRHRNYFQGVYTDAWGEAPRLLKRDPKRPNQMGMPLFNDYELVSAGPDRKFGTADDVVMFDQNQWWMAQWWWLADETRLAQLQQQGQWGRGRQDGMLLNRNALLRELRKELQDNDLDGRQERAERFLGAVPPPVAAVPLMDAAEQAAPDVATAAPGGANGGPPVRIREYFPETMLWQPTLITDDKGVAVLPLSFADSITTWRLSASANSQNGLLGGVTTPLRVFQDFFVDLDLPISLTQNDEVAFPVAVYNYLKTPQTVTLRLEAGDWFDLLDTEGYSRSLDLKPNEVTAVKFRIRAKKIGFQPLTVKAVGSKLSDAIKRVIEVTPDGKRVEQVVNDRLTGTVTQTITIPDDALPDASKIIVKLYPGVFSQVLEGTEGILRLPGGCFEQTSSSAYPNVLVVDYMKKTGKMSPEILMKSEQYLNVGYQRLLTFERPGGGFDWWGSGPPLIWLSAYGLQEFNDMAKVYPVDPGVIERTRNWLLQQQSPDGTWSNIGATHGETIQRMGDPKLLLTSYVTWSLLDSGARGPRIDKAVNYILDHIDDAKGNAYILALAANALAAWNPKDDRTLAVVKTLSQCYQMKPEWEAGCFPVQGAQTLTYATSDQVTVETTALAAMAMIRTGQFTEQVNKALTYLIKSKGSDGHWGSTSATILSLKALLTGLGGMKQEGTGAVSLRVNGKVVGKAEITPENSDVMQLFDIQDGLRTGGNDVRLEVTGQANLMYQIVGRYYEPWQQPLESRQPVVSIAVDYDRTELTTADLLRAKATLHYNGASPTYNVIVDLGIPPGFTVDPGDFAEMVGKKQVEKFTVTARQITLYLGDVKPGDVKAFEYTLKPKYPIKAKTPATVAYEYYTPTNRATTQPVELTVKQK